MNEKVLRLYPLPGLECDLHGLYLRHRLHELGSSESPFVYANFVTSLDGRIALEDVHGGKPYVPKTITTHNDFRLFLELEAQADCLITHGGYLRALAGGELGNILQVGVTTETEDLATWRQANGLSPQPALVVASSTLNFPMPQSIADHSQACYIVTGAEADPGRIAKLRDRGFEILIAGRGKWVEGNLLIRQLGQLGFSSIYLIAGPNMLDTMLRGRQLSRYYQTMTHQLIGGKRFHTLLPGPEMGPAGHLQLSHLYYDPASPDNTGQWFAQFSVAHAG